MSNFPHSTSLATSLSTSPYATQSNLETLIQNAHTHPHPRRTSQSSARSHHQPHYGAAGLSPLTPAVFSPDLPDDAPPGSRRQSEAHHPSTRPRFGTIRETSYNEGAMFLDESDDEADGLLPSGTKSRRQSSMRSRRDSRASRTSRTSTNRRNHGGISDPIGWTPVNAPSGGRRGSIEARAGPRGTSKSRSTARTPPRRNRMGMAKPGDHPDGNAGSSSASDDNDVYGEDEQQDHEEYFDFDDTVPHKPGSVNTIRGRVVDERPLSRSSSPFDTRSEVSGRVRRDSKVGRRGSMAQSTRSRFGADSEYGDQEDMARGLSAMGGEGMLGVKGGNGMIPGHMQSGVIGVMDLDPAEELLAEDLEVPLDKDGLEIRDWKEALKAECIIVMRMGVPVFATQAAEWSLVLASVISIGHQGTTELAASSHVGFKVSFLSLLMDRLASMTASVSSFSILQGLATAMDTLLPAAWASSEPSRVGLWTQRMAVVMAFSTIPMYVLWWNVERILLAAGQEPRVAALAQTYLRCMSFGIPGYAGQIVVKKYLQAQNLMQIPTYALFIVSPLNVLMNYLLVWGPDPIRIGFAGGAIATAISYTLNFVLLLLWVLYYGPKEAMHPVEMKSLFSKLGTVTSLGLAGTIMVSSEWWAWEACALAASLLGPVNLAAQSVLLSTTSTFFQVPAALGIASAVRVGNLLGAGRGWESKWASRACLFLSIFFASINSLICIIFRKNWGYIFNNDPIVVGIVASIMPYIGLFQITDGIAATSGSILRALGLHTTGALINLTSYYVIGLPFGFWLTFEPKLNLGLKGLWIGLSVALGYASVASFVLVWRTNWGRAVERVRERLGLPTQGQVGEDGKWEESQNGDGFEGRLEGIEEEGEYSGDEEGGGGRRKYGDVEVEVTSPGGGQGRGEREGLLNDGKTSDGTYGATRE